MNGELRLILAFVGANYLKGVFFLLGLVGTYEHNIDGKNRLFVPAKFRAILGNEFIYKVRRSKFPSIQLYSKEQFFKEAEEAVAGIKDETRRKMVLDAKFFGTGEATCDAQGRIVISTSISKSAKLEKECVLTGYGNFVEIMSSEVYYEYGEELLRSAEMEAESYRKEEELRCQRRSDGAYLDTEI